MHTMSDFILYDDFFRIIINSIFKTPRDARQNVKQLKSAVLQIARIRPACQIAIAITSLAKMVISSNVNKS